MKLVNSNFILNKQTKYLKWNIISILVISILSLIQVSQSTLKFESRKNSNLKKQNDSFNPDYKVFPNQYEAATSPDNLNSANFTAPPLSRALFETNPTRKLSLSDFIKEIRFPMYNLTRGETEQIFYFTDKSKDELIDQEEYDAFAMLYIYPFEACDANHDYLLDEKEFKKCFENDPVKHFISIRYIYKDNYMDKLMDSFTTRSAHIINFADYLLFKKATFGWKECQSTASYMSKDAFTCAVRTSLPVLYHLNSDIIRFYDAGLSMVSDYNLIEMDFIAYMRTFYYTYVFIIFSNNQDTPALAKSDFLKSIRDDRIPQNFAESDVDYLYDLMNNNPTHPRYEMNPESFFFWFNLHRLFNKYSVNRPMQITQDELLKLLNDRFSSEKLIHSIDSSLTNFSTAQYAEASLVLNRYRTNEREFFYKFKETESTVIKEKQDASALSQSFWNHTENRDHTYWPTHLNETNRKVFYNIATNNGKYSWTRKTYFKVMQLAEFYTSFTKDSTFLVPVTTFHSDLYKKYDTFNPPINMKQRINYGFYKNLPRDLRMDLFSFLCLEMWRDKFDDIKLYSNKFIEEADLKIVLNDYGMRNMPDPVLDLAKKGYDRLRRRIYDPKETIIHIISVQAAASELVRTQAKMKKYDLKENKEWSRKFFNWGRRFEASPRV